MPIHFVSYLEPLHLCLHMILNAESIEKLKNHCHVIYERKPQYPIITK